MDDTPISSDEEDANALRKRDAPRAADPHDFGGAEEALNDAARRVNAVWISFIVLCVYIFIATFTVTPAMLFRDAPVKLPIFNAELPLKVYFVMAPVLVLALHAYLIVLTKGLTEKIDAYEDVLKRSVKILSSRRALRARLDNSIVIRALSAKYRDTRTAFDHACGFIAGLTMVFMPVALLLLTQLVFLPYHHEWMTRFHRGFVAFDVGMCLWLLWPLTPWRVMARRSMVLTFILFACATSIFFAAFPGEWMYEALAKTPAHGVTVWAFEGPPDPVDYVHKGGVLPFPNRLILPDDPKLAEVAGASSGGVSLSVRGRNFRKAVFDRSNLARVDFSAAGLTKASLQGAKLEGAKFECATPAFGFNWEDGAGGGYDSTPGRDCTSLNGVSLSHAKLDGASFRGARMNGADLESTVVKNANFSGAELLGARFNNAQGSAANFSDARLTGADFGNTRLLAANFNDARLQGARLSDAQLLAAEFDNAHMQGADLSYANLLAASFTTALLQTATLNGADLKGADFESASLRGASLKCVTPFRTIFGNVGRVGSANIEIKVPITELSQTFVTPPNAKCETRSFYSEIIDTYYPYAPDKYDGVGDDTVGFTSGGWGGTDGWGIYSDYPDFIPELQHPEKLDANTFAAALNKATSDLPEDAKTRVRNAFERLKPGARTTKQDDAEKAYEKAYWAAWAKKSASQESHDKALAARLESIACVAEGAPYVARGLLRSGRFDRLYENKETNEKEKNRILERLKKASGGGDPSCLGAKGLVEADFPKPAQ